MKARTPRTHSSSDEGAAGDAAASADALRMGGDEGPGVYRPQLGLEIEMVVADAHSGASFPVHAYFEALGHIKQASGLAWQPVLLEGRCVAGRTPVAECGLDNGYNLLETALSPVEGGPGGLARLALLAHQELADTIEALQSDEACVLNVAQHPACARDPEWYAKVCVPRPIYRELRGHRGWHHWEGIDAKAQNGANTSVPVAYAVEALNVAIALAPASIALFANSPLESGQLTGLKDTRMTLWPRVFGPARFPGDALLCQYPQRPFRDLGDFFRWMFGPGTVTRGLPVESSYDYKSVATVLLDRDPCLTDFLQSPGWTGRRNDDGSAVELMPQAAHFEYSQIGQFLDARLRYRWERMPSLPELLAAWEREGGLESLFGACGAQTYIEARAPGAGFADTCLLREAGAASARSLLLAPSALQAGLLGNLDAASQLVKQWGWQNLGRLRETAIRDGMENDRVRALCEDVLHVARAGLGASDHQWLAYADFVLASGRSGADRLIDTWQSGGATHEQRLKSVVSRHAALHPALFGEARQRP